MSRSKIDFVRGWFATVAGVCAAGVLVAVFPATAIAQAQDGFVPATDIAKETLPALPLVYAAYAFAWIAVIGYVVLLWQRLSRVEKELREVTARLGAPRR